MKKKKKSKISIWYKIILITLIILAVLCILALLIAGLSALYQKGYDNAVKEIYNKTLKQGYDTGYNAGYTLGYNDSLNDECQPVVLAKEIMSEHTYNNNASNGEIYNCVNYTTSYLDLLRQNDIMASRTSLYKYDKQIGHQVACVLIDPQNGQFIGVNQWDEAYSPIWCQAQT